MGRMTSRATSAATSAVNAASMSPTSIKRDMAAKAREANGTEDLHWNRC